MPELFYKTTPFAHQVEGVKFGMNRERFFLGDEQGLGKTKQAIDIAVNNKIYYEYTHCLIVACVNSLKWNWYNEVYTHSDEEAHILGMRTNKRGRTVIKGMKERIEDLDNFDELPFFVITNVESFRNPEFADKLQKLCTSGKIKMCVADELHKCKNPQSQQSKGFLKIQCEYRMAMTGTPIMNSPLDMYLILRWLGLEKHSFYAFRNHFCIKGGFNGKDIIGYKHLDQLDNMTHQIMLRRLKKDVLDLPDKIYIDDIVEMLPKQEKLYDDVLNSVLNDIDKILLSPSPLSALIRLRQCTGYTGILSSEIEESAKLDRMEEIVEEVVANNDKVIIFSNWTQITDEVMNRLQRFNPVQITGATDENARELSRDTFQNDDSCKVIVGTIGAMGTGLTLTAATTVIFLDHPWTRALYDQAVDRAHRIGQKNNVTIHNIMCKDTLDIKVYDTVIKKGLVADVILDNNAPINKTEFVNMLLS